MIDLVNKNKSARCYSYSDFTKKSDALTNRSLVNALCARHLWGLLQYHLSEGFDMCWTYAVGRSNLSPEWGWKEIRNNASLMHWKRYKKVSAYWWNNHFEKRNIQCMDNTVTINSPGESTEDFDYRDRDIRVALFRDTELIFFKNWYKQVRWKIFAEVDTRSKPPLFARTN